MADEPEETTEVQEITEEEPTDGDEPMTLENARKLRSENKTLRDRAKDAEARAALADGYARSLFQARVAATGRLANPDELAFDAALLDDSDALSSAIDALIEQKPYVQARKYGEVGQGQRNGGAPADFSSLLR